jgi:hypothetical protein
LGGGTEDATKGGTYGSADKDIAKWASQYGATG